LIAHSIEHAKGAISVGRTIVSTEDHEIASVALSCGAEVIDRPRELADDTTSSEAVLLHSLSYLEKTERFRPDLVVFLQCTSPIREPQDIERAVQLLLNENADSLLSVSHSHVFLWRRHGGNVDPLNYDYRERRRRQDKPEEFIENGSIYVFKPWVLEKLNNRLGGRIVLFEMDYWSSFQIDSPEEFELCEWILNRRKFREGRPSMAGRIS
jgi:CMP-N,N'-diacetyllegionaminic acid synthase